MANRRVVFIIGCKARVVFYDFNRASVTIITASVSDYKCILASLDARKVLFLILCALNSKSLHRFPASLRPIKIRQLYLSACWADW